MKKILLIFLSIVFIYSNINNKSYAEQEKSNNEMRAAWITTIYNQDWPSEKSKNNVQMQKDEFISILDDLKELGFNAVVVQVRPKGDAIYNSSINPWSEVLTGTQGKDPGYDPLEFMIQEAHKRGMELHAWFNPYRITTTGTDINSLSDIHPAKQNQDMIMKYDFYSNGQKRSALCYNPGLPEVREHIINTITEVVKNYDVDGIHFDDYFYPSGEYDDDNTYMTYGNGMDKDNWRRENVNLLIKEVYEAIKSINSSVEFGVSPRGIWKNKSSDITGSDTNGAESYYDIYCDTRTWIRNGWIDYVTPQIYWEIGNKAADYSKLVEWWSNEVRGYKTKLYIGQGIYKDIVAKEIEEQINLNRTYDNIYGSMYFSYRDIKNDRCGIRNTLNQLNSNISNDSSGSNDTPNVAEKYYLEIKKFYGEDSVNNAMSKLNNELGWYVSPEKIYYDRTKYRIVTGEFINEAVVKEELNNLMNSTGWWATYEPTSNEKYRIVTGEFIGEESVINALNHIKEKFGWWATYEKTTEKQYVYEYDQYYRIITGEFINEAAAKEALNNLVSSTGWWATYETTSNGKYRIVTGEFRGIDSVQNGLNKLIANTGWWATYEETERRDYVYKIKTGYFPNKESATDNLNMILNKYGWYCELKKYE